MKLYADKSKAETKWKNVLLDFSKIYRRPKTGDLKSIINQTLIRERVNMKKFVYLSYLLLIAFISCSQQNDFPKLTGPYLGQKTPGQTPEIFAPGIISFGDHEHHMVFSTDGNEMFYVVADNYRRHHIILTVVQKNGVWLEPEVAPFSGIYSDFAPSISPDGKYLMFCSNRPMPGDTADVGDFNIWKVVKQNGEWGTPEPLPYPVNDETNEYNPTIAESGNLYFQDNDESGVDIYFSKYDNGKYSVPEKLPETINTKYPEIGPWITPDEKVLFFSSDRPGSLGSMDIYYSKKGNDGNWMLAQNAGDNVNTPFGDAIPVLTPDGKYLFYVSFKGIPVSSIKGKKYKEILKVLNSPQNRDGTSYWVDVAELLRK